MTEEPRTMWMYLRVILRDDYDGRDYRSLRLCGRTWKSTTYMVRRSIEMELYKIHVRIRIIITSYCDGLHTRGDQYYKYIVL